MSQSLASLSFPTDFEREEKLRALLACYESESLREDMIDEMDLFFTALLEDPSPRMRHILADGLAHSQKAPRHVILRLAQESPEISLFLLARSPLLTDLDLLERFSGADISVQSAIALRPHLSQDVTHAFIDRGQREAIITLLRNEGADISLEGYRALFEKFHADAEIQEALENRRDLPLEVRMGFILHAQPPFALPQDQKQVILSTWLVEECRRGACPTPCFLQLAQAHYLTPAFLLRILLCGDLSVLRMAFHIFGNISLERATHFLQDPMGYGFAALYFKVGLPAAFLSLFRQGIHLVWMHGETPLPVEGEGLHPCRAMIETLLHGGKIVPSHEAFLLRLQAEISYRDMRRKAQETLAQAPILARLSQPAFTDIQKRSTIDWQKVEKDLYTRLTKLGERVSRPKIDVGALEYDLLTQLCSDATIQQETGQVRPSPSIHGTALEKDLKGRLASFEARRAA